MLIVKQEWQYVEFDWENSIVIFTDEKSFRSDKDGRKILWRRPWDRYDPNNILPLRTSGRITLGKYLQMLSPKWYKYVFVFKG